MPEQLERYEQKPLSEQTKQNLMDQLTLADHLVYKSIFQTFRTMRW